MNTEKRYRFEPLTSENRHIWFQTVLNSSCAPVMKVCDEYDIDLQLKENRAAGNVIVYDDKAREAVAVFPGEIAKERFAFMPLRILKSKFGGLLVRDDYFQHALPLKEFVFRQVVNGYYKKNHKVDYLQIVFPPKTMIENPGLIYSLLPLYQSDVELNSILYVKLDDDFLTKFKFNVKREIMKGLENLKQLRVSREKDSKMLGYLTELERQKASVLGIRPISQPYFTRILNSRFYYPFVALENEKPLSAVVCTYHRGIGTFTYNASTEKAKKLFVNKALLFTAMQACRENGGKYFVLGNGWEYSKPGQKKQVKRVNFFKRSFSTHEATTYEFKYPLSKKGAVAILLAQLRRRRFCER